MATLGARINDFSSSVDSLVNRRRKTDAPDERKGRFGAGTQAGDERDLIKIGNSLVQDLRAAGRLDDVTTISNLVFNLRKRVPIRRR